MGVRAAVIVASSSGLDRAPVQSLAQEGRDLVITGRDPRDLEAMAADVALHPYLLEGVIGVNRLGPAKLTAALGQLIG